MRKILMLILISSQLQAGEWSYENRRSLSSDAMSYFGETQNNTPPKEKKEFKVYSLGGKVSLLGDCGNLNFKASFKSIYSEANRLFSDLKEAALGSVKDITKAAPMLALCYFSPTACSIAKNLQLYGSYTAKLKFDQCEAINKYISNQGGVYKEQQAVCLRKKMSESGNITEAVESCQSSADKLASWLDGSSTINETSNNLIQTSAKWAGIPESEAKLIGALVGGIEFESRGTLRVNFGNYAPVTPGRLLEYYTKTAYKKLCGEKGTLEKWGSRNKPDLGDSDYFQSKGRNLLNRELMDSLARLPAGERQAACDRLAGAMSLTKFVDEMEERFDQLYVMSQNPHLPETERDRLERKTQKLIDHTLAVLKIKNLKQDTLNSVRSNILTESAKIAQRNGERATDINSPKKIISPFDTCDDFTICGGN